MKKPIGSAFLKKEKNLNVILLIFVFSLVLNLTFNRPFILDADEAHMIRRTMAVMSGELPLVDFTFFTYNPGIYFLLASLFWLFSPSMIAARLLWVAFRCIINILTYVTARRTMPPLFALVPVAIVSFVPCAAYKSFYPLFILANLYMLIRFVAEFEKKWLLLSGLMTGITFWFRQDIGGFSALCFGISIIIHKSSQLRSPHTPVLTQFRIFITETFKSIGAYASMVILGFSPVFVYYTIRSQGYNLIYQMAIGRPSQELAIRTSDRYHFPNITEIFHLPVHWDVVFLWFPLFLFFIILVFLVDRRLKQSFRPRENWYVFVTLLMAFFTFYQTFIYPNYERILENGVIIYILIGYMVYRIFSGSSKSIDPNSRRRSTGLILKAFLIAALLLFPTWFTYYGLTKKSVNDRLMVRRDNDVIKSNFGVWLPKQQTRHKIQGVVKFTREKNKRGEPILFIQSYLVYFYADPKNLEVMNISIKHFSEENLISDMRILNPKFIAVENWAYNSLDRLPQTFHVWFERKYRLIAHKDSYSIYTQKKRKKLSG